MRFRFFHLALALGLLTLPQGALAAEKLMMATTTSTLDTGLLDELKPLFESENGFELNWVSVGTGKALQHGKNCDVDVLLVHSPAQEKKFVDEGYGVGRRQVMYNDFVLVGPASDPAQIKGKKVPDAFAAFYKHGATFVSRGDNSGTHNAEKKQWKAAKLPVPGKAQTWYIDAGQGMMATLRMAAEKNGYAITDRGTFIKYEAAGKGNVPLKILVEGDKSLLNQYSVMMVNPARCPKVKQDMAQKFIAWWVSPATQKKIAAFRLQGKQLFFPNAK